MEDEPILLSNNRAFLYGDGFFESMVMFNNRIPLLSFHLARIERSMQLLGAVLPSKMSSSQWTNQVNPLSQANGGHKNARLRIQFFRDGGGFYLPDSKESSYLLSMDAIKNQEFQIGNGLLIGSRRDAIKPSWPFSELKSVSALPYVLYAQMARSENWDEMILLNQDGRVCEAVHSNVFVVAGEQIVTPPLEDGCVGGVMRACLLSNFPDKIRVGELTTTMLEDADEILLTNAVKGIQWVREMNRKIYGNSKARELTDWLNKKLLG